jgi:uncharacterized damage-inducible protein DinB
MESKAVLLEVYGRIPPLVRDVLRDLPADALVARPGPKANSIAWLVWHLTRVQDHHASDILKTEQLWVGGGWAERVGLAPDPNNTGYGHSPDDVASVKPRDPSILEAYLEAVQARSVSMLEKLTPTDLDRIVDRRWDPPVTMGVRLISIADDSLQHVGQAAYIRGLLGY